MRVQGKLPRTKKMGEGEGGGLMFKYVDFLHFDFRGINLSNLRHYGIRVQCNNGVARRVSSRPMNTHYKENSIPGKFTCNCMGKYAF